MNKQNNITTLKILLQRKIYVIQKIFVYLRNNSLDFIHKSSYIQKLEKERKTHTSFVGVFMEMKSN